MVSNNLGLIFVVLAVIYIGNNSVVLEKLKAELSDTVLSDITKKKEHEHRMVMQVSNKLFVVIAHVFCAMRDYYQHFGCIYFWF